MLRRRFKVKGLIESSRRESRMRRRVMAAVDELGYEPDFLAQSLRRGATLSIGFVLGDISNPITSDIALGLEDELGLAGYALVLMISKSAPLLDEAHIRFLKSGRVDGMVLSVANKSRRSIFAALGPFPSS